MTHDPVGALPLGQVRVLSYARLACAWVSDATVPRRERLSPSIGLPSKPRRLPGRSAADARALRASAARPGVSVAAVTTGLRPRSDVAIVDWQGCPDDRACPQ